MRISPAVKRELPPASASGARSRTSTRSADSRAESAAHRAALPPPTTITSQWTPDTFYSGGGPNRRSRLAEKIAQHERQDAAVLVVVHLDRRVDAQQQRDFLRAAVGSPDHERRVLLRPDLALDAANVQGLVAFDPERRDRVAAFELEGEHTHADEVRAMDALEALHDHRAHAEQQRALRRPVARAARPVLLAAEHHGRDAFGDVFHRRLVDRHLLAGRLVDSDAAFGARAVGLHRKHQVLDAHVAEGAAHHDLVVAAARAEAVELGHRHVMLLQINAGGGSGLDRARGADVVRRQRVAEDPEDARTAYRSA